MTVVDTSTLHTIKTFYTEGWVTVRTCGTFLITVDVCLQLIDVIISQTIKEHIMGRTFCHSNEKFKSSNQFDIV